MRNYIGWRRRLGISCNCDRRRLAAYPQVTNGLYAAMLVAKERFRAYPNNIIWGIISIAHRYLWLDDWHSAETLPWTNGPSRTNGASPTICGRPSPRCFLNIKTHTASAAVGRASPTASAWKPSSSCCVPAANGRHWTPPSSAPVPPPTTAFRSGSKRASLRNYGNTV
jgi:hypothetical protein